VELEYNALSGKWWRYHEPQSRHEQTYLEYVEGPLTVSSGKPDIIKELAGSSHGRRFMIGDGSSDLATRDVVDLFVGYGGVVSRDNVKRDAEVFIESVSLAPVLPLAAGPAGYAKVRGTHYQALFEKGIDLVRASDVIFHDDAQRYTFEKAFTNLD
jgi:hypothetical protein